MEILKKKKKKKKLMLSLSTPTPSLYYILGARLHEDVFVMDNTDCILVIFHKKLILTKCADRPFLH